MGVILSKCQKKQMNGEEAGQYIGLVWFGKLAQDQRGTTAPNLWQWFEQAFCRALNLKHKTLTISTNPTLFQSKIFQTSTPHIGIKISRETLTHKTFKTKDETLYINIES